MLKTYIRKKAKYAQSTGGCYNIYYPTYVERDNGIISRPLTNYLILNIYLSNQILVGYTVLY